MRLELNFYGTANANPVEVVDSPWGESPIPRVGEYVSLQDDDGDGPSGTVNSVNYFLDHVRVTLKR